MVEKLIPLETGGGKPCQCGRWRSWEDYEHHQLCECGRRLAMVKHCSICRKETAGAPLCDQCARKMRRDCKLVHLDIAGGACGGSGTVDNLRRDEALLKGYDEWKEANNA